jgi:hypothetical protein
MCARLTGDREAATSAILSLARFNSDRAVDLLRGVAADNSNPQHLTAIEALSH